MNIRRKYPMYSLDSDYVEKARNLSDIKLVILGKDPYPSGASNIPFVKDTWADLTKDSAGYNVFRSLGGESVQTEYESPKKFVFHLLSRNIVLLNCSYNYLEKETVSQKNHAFFINTAFDNNLSILERAKRVLMCGGAEKMLSMVAVYDEGIFEKVPHPSGQSRNGAEDKSAWNKVWSINALNKAIKSDS